MKTCRKILALCLSLLLLLSALTSCHGTLKKPEREEGSTGSSATQEKKATFDVPAFFDTSKQYKITFWAKNDTNITQKYIYEQAVAGFQAAYPNVTVTIQQYTDYREIYNDVIKNIPTKTTPNVCISYPDHIATYLTGENVVVPLDSLMTNEKYGFGGSDLAYDGVSKDGVIAKFLDEGKIGGVQYVLPFMRSSEAVYINRNMLEKLGYTVPDILTWDFIWEACDAAMAMGKDADGNFKLNGQKTLIPFIYKSTDNMMIQYAEQAGSGYATEDGKIQLFNDKTKEFLYTVAAHVENKSFSTFKISSYPGNYFNAEQCLFALDSTAGATWMGPEAPLQDIPEDSRRQFETVVRAVPQVDTENPKMISQGPSVCVFSKEDPQEVLAAWLFAQYLLSDSVQVAYAKTEGYVPVTNDARETEDYKSYLANAGADNDEHYKVKIDATRLVLDNIANTFITPVFYGSASLREAAGELIEGTARQVRRGKTVDAAFMNSFFSDTISLKRLTVDDNSQTDVNSPLPTEARILLIAVVCVWVVIGACVLIPRIKRRKTEKIAQ